jgi:LmbE family N-acetylglucosaminyl deacetylase
MAARWPERWPPEIERVLALTPHPDDELFCAGLLARAAAGGARVTLVCATLGQKGLLFGRRAPAAEVAALRAAELEGSARALGISAAENLGFDDGRLGDEAAGAIAEAIDRFEPDLIVSFAADGGYGHRDHVKLVELIEGALGEREERARWLQCVFPPGAFGDTTETMRRARPELLAPGTDPGGVSIDQVDWIVESAPTEWARRAAVAAHASQRWMLDSLPALKSDEEWYRDG